MDMKERSLNIYYSIDGGTTISIYYGDVHLFSGKNTDNYREQLKDVINVDKIDFIIKNIPLLAESRKDFSEYLDVDTYGNSEITYTSSAFYTTNYDSMLVSCGKGNHIEEKFFKELATFDDNVNLKGQKIYISKSITYKTIYSFDAEQYTEDQALKLIENKNIKPKFILNNESFTHATTKYYDSFNEKYVEDYKEQNNES